MHAELLGFPTSEINEINVSISLTTARLTSARNTDCSCNDGPRLGSGHKRERNRCSLSASLSLSCTAAWFTRRAKERVAWSTRAHNSSSPAGDRPTGAAWVGQRARQQGAIPARSQRLPTRLA